jgi:VWFA-related protein
VKRVSSFLVAATLAVPLSSPTQTLFLSGTQNQETQNQVTTREVIVPVTVTDAKGEFVLYLEEKDFFVYEDGIQQTINSWELGGESLGVVLLIDTSSRHSAMQSTLHRSASIFTSTVMLDGEAAVVTYDSTVDVVQPFTESHESVERAVAGTKFNGGATNLYDGMAASIELLKTRPPARRRILVIMGESQDTSSKAKLREVLREAGNANISIFVVGLSGVVADVHESAPLKLPGLPPIQPGPCIDAQQRSCFDLASATTWLLQRGTNEIKRHQLELAAAATGGIDYRAFRDSQIQLELDRIGAELHAQYVLSYNPSSKWTPGFHRITVNVHRANTTVRTRPGYYVPADE